MTAPEGFLPLLAGLLAVLLLASAGLALLRARRDPQRGSRLLDALSARLQTWWAMVALLSLAMLFGHAGVVVLFALISFAALREFLTLTAKHRADHLALAAAFFVVLPVQYLLIGIDWYGFYAIFIPVYAFLFLPILSALRNEGEGFLTRVSETQWALMLCVFALSHVPALLSLRFAGQEGRPILLIAFLVVTVQGAELVQFALSHMRVGRPLAPRLSRFRTGAGLAGGALGAAALGLALFWLTPFAPWQAAALALAAALTGLLGGLVMSAIKRDRGVRDWGHLIPGQGGVLDAAEAVIFAAPVFFHLVRYFFSAV
jgi:phosphatidate cytidylyltransferase